MNENQFPTIHLNVFVGGTVSGHVKVDFVLESQVSHSNGVNRCDLAQREQRFPTLPVIKAEAELLGEVALQGDEVKPVAVDNDRIILHLHGFFVVWGCDDATFLILTPGKLYSDTLNWRILRWHLGSVEVQADVGETQEQPQPLDHGCHQQ